MQKTVSIFREKFLNFSKFSHEVFINLIPKQTCVMYKITRYYLLNSDIRHA
jgi:hypothetical protein